MQLLEVSALTLCSDDVFQSIFQLEVNHTPGRSELKNFGFEKSLYLSASGPGFLDSLLSSPSA